MEKRMALSAQYSQIDDNFSRSSAIILPGASLCVLSSEGELVFSGFPLHYLHAYPHPVSP
jgi:hypothetical protein